ncbi:MAG: MBOAT family protein [Coriobacteriales bacterium]|jgi:alginate O-acetyltransferase complex protein AlgI|nr:MBOAT family protein [Coriobacteriales bacterium]
MYFATPAFLCVFLPVVFLLYLLLPGIRTKNALLIVASVLFYAYGEPIYVLLMLLSSLVNWGFGLLLGKQQKKKLFLVLAVVVNLGFLGVFKYAGMVAESLGALIGTELPFRGILLPIGISFYTFQALSYVIDVYRGELSAQRNYSKVLLYITFFPQLISGPIIKYHDVETQLSERTVTLEGVSSGLRRFAVGLAKKVLIANQLGVAATAVYDAAPAQVNVVVAWIGALAFLAQIYFDFSGYSDIAIGLARMFGFNYKENFNYPYTSTSIKEFWRRWHISLSTWFKEYLYIPLGGNRKGRGRSVLNKLIVFGLCGLWHGANWTFVIWGLFHGLFLLIEEYLPIKKLPRALGWFYMLLVVCVGFVLFESETFGQALFMLQQMFTGFAFSPDALALTFSLLDPLTILTFCIAIVAATPVAKWVAGKLRAKGGFVLESARVAGYAGAFVLIVLCFLALAGAEYNPFIYFRF